ncbi:MAG: ATP-binding cassette domain-containing protein [Bacteroidales bacterium]|nr:ATP-binding cassette domain-containing protein [Bacteroidales bacterium]MDD3961868.1 ATP-binding cassette domain-containing protein [Bacteroidales bacterium]MDY0286546.1 ATP-binding cassette domain-containing protein [Bacteroidales bacterium]
MIQALNIHKTFHNQPVLNNVSVDFHPGATNLIIGKSGSGKTVLMKILVGLITPDSGKISFNDRDFLSMNTKQKKTLRQEIGMLFQGGALFDSMSVQDNIMFPLSLFSSMSYHEKLDRVNFCLKRVNLEKANHLMPSELSGGMTKRVAIARAIAPNPKYLFCDEPNSGLDPKTSGIIDNLIKEITKEYHITTIINTHDMNSVLETGEYITYIHEGQVNWQGNKQTVLSEGTNELNDFMFSTALTRKIKTVPLQS